MFLDSALNINRTNIVHRMYILGNSCAVLQKTSGKSLHFVNPTLQPWRWIQMTVMQYYDDILATDFPQTP